MRLTLRTLLAYLDGNLEPDDSQDIGKKIEESEFATKLVHLIRDCTRRLRLGAPPLMGRGLGADSNSVAEYLEYRLPDERVPEFERICLESEIHLAEVASCHQILTLVLGEPAEIAVETRERLYALAAHVDSSPVEEAKAPVKAPAAAIPPAPPITKRPKLEVPEYLRESRWRWWPVAALVLVGATLTFAGLLVFGPPQLRQRVVGLVQASADQAGSQPSDQAAPKDADPPTEPAAGRNPAAVETRPEEPTTVEDPTGRDPAVAVPEKPSGEDPLAPPAPEPAQPEPAKPVDPSAATTSDPLDKPLPGEPSKPAPEAEPDKKPQVAPSGEQPPAPAAEPVKQEDAPREPPESFGRYTSKLEVLLKLNPQTGDWVRLPATAPLNKSDRLLSLPAFRPTLTLGSNVTIQADGPALFELVGWTDEEIPILAVEFGRLLMLTVGKADNSLQLKIDGHETLLTFVDAESTLAVEVGHELPAGKDPEGAAAPVWANVYATSGLIRLRAGDDAPVELQAPAQRSLVHLAEEQPADAKFPTWVTSEEQSDIDRLATGQVDRHLTIAKPAGLQLRELADPQKTRRREVRSLAVRSLMYLDDFEPCVKAMNDENERLFWPQGMDELRAAVARGPKTAARVRAAFENERGAEAGAGLYRILWGYSSTDLSGGADRDLVEALNSDALDFRVMSFLTLQDLTGATHGYRPDDQEIKRRTAYKSWKQRIGKITPRSDRSPSKSRSTKGD
ncbi:MAG: hypothetical protein WD063_12985 [Pirellulales bacterium]